MAERPMAWDFDNGPANHTIVSRRRPNAGERVVRSAGYAPVVFGRCGDESAANQNMRYRDAVAPLTGGEGA